MYYDLFKKLQSSFSISRSEEADCYWNFKLRPMELENYTRDEIIDALNDLINQVEDEIDGYDEDPDLDARIDEAIMRDKGMFL